MRHNINVDLDTTEAIAIIRKKLSCIKDTEIVDAIIHLITMSDAYVGMFFKTCIGMSLPEPDYKEGSSVYLKEGHISKYRWNVEKSREEGYIDKNDLIPAHIINYNPFGNSYKVGYNFINSEDKRDTTVDHISNYAIDSVRDNVQDIAEDIF